MNYKEKIKDFVGEGGFVAFEHGFICKGGYTSKHIKCVSVSDIEVSYFMQAHDGLPASKWKRNIDSLPKKEAREVYRDLCEYLEYCHTYA